MDKDETHKMKMNEANLVCSGAVRSWTWRDRWRARLFPFTPCDLPEAPATFKDVLVTKTRTELSWADRLRILVTGKVEVEVRVVTEHAVGETRTKSVLRAGRFWG